MKIDRFGFVPGHRIAVAESPQCRVSMQITGRPAAATQPVCRSTA
ncbi:MAG TPA: hypothetical protein VGH14_07505 [Solirubrobacterales bacterium]